MIRLAHLSDIHVTVPALDWQRADWFNKRLAAWFNFRWLGRGRRFRHADAVLALLIADIRRRRPDRLIFSGDATALGFESEFRHAAQLLGVQDHSGPPAMAVPGNHDYCTRPAAESGLFERYFAPWQIGERIDDQLYPFAQKVGDVWLVGLNTSTGNRWCWDAGGRAGPEQLQRLGQLLATLSPGPRILVTHFPVRLSSGRPEPWTRCLRDLDAVVRVATAGGVCLWLHGHRHNAYYHVRTDLAAFPVVCAGSATQTGLWSYGEYTIDGSQFRAQVRVFDPLNQGFCDGSTFVLQLAC
jgi:3',5'-cyclic AMP phosphodiesterase CpdA